MPKTILIVDDEPDSVAMFASVLRERGYNVVTATSGEQALAMVKQGQPDLILLDILMPKIDGTDVASALREDERTKDIPVFFVTALVSPADEVNLRGDSRKQVFAKPVNLSELLSCIQNELRD